MLAVRYRAEWDCPNPYCFCGADIGVPTESAIYLADMGEYAGEYVAGCVKNSCGYLGECYFRSFDFTKTHVGFIQSHCSGSVAYLTLRKDRTGLAVV